MRRLLFVLLLLCRMAWGQNLDCGGGSCAHANITSGSSLSFTLSTNNTNCIIHISVTVNSTTVSSISSTHTTGWARRKSTTSNVIEEWDGTASGTLSSESITVTLAGSTGFATGDAFGISGANTSTKYDSNASLPASCNTNGCDPLSVSTANASDFIYGCYRMQSISTPGVGTGWTKISGADFQLCEYQVVSSTQSGLSVAMAAGNGQGNSNAGIADAFVASGSSSSSSGFNKRRKLEQMQQ